MMEVALSLGLGSGLYVFHARLGKTCLKLKIKGTVIL